MLVKMLLALSNRNLYSNWLKQYGNNLITREVQQECSLQGKLIYWATSWLSKNWALSLLSSTWCWLSPLADGKIATVLSGVLSRQQQCPEELPPGWLSLRSEEVFSRSSSLMPSWPLLSCWPELGPCLCGHWWPVGLNQESPESRRQRPL